MKKLNIALLVISLFFVVIFGALIIANNYTINVVVGEESQVRAVGDYVLDFIPVVKNYKQIDYTVAGALLIAFSMLAGASASNIAKTNKKIKRKKITKKKIVGGKVPQPTQPTQLQTRIRF